ncbi:MAG: hypothetical protein COV44_05365 [Deltaproteobacteria bacterium CG11_big_fil_rev_8_21_14_0_20_45_16]|nr:MAG: hypothetical protein COV44_05365 [Deltaproteobacteria bacterium CG11_big_fil_rev_8_21_14_0_20_45_16]
MKPIASQPDYSFHVLIVDDDITILGLLKEIVSLVPGCQVSTASKPDDAMQFIIKGGVDIVFTDVHMPGVTGIEMLEDILSLEKSPELIVMTAYPTGEVAQSAMELGASSLLAKPFEDISLVELELDKAIRKLLRQRASSQEVVAKKEELKKKNPNPEVDNDPVMKVSLPSQSSEATPASVNSYPSEEGYQKKLYPLSLLEPMVEIEVQRCSRNNRPFTLGFVDIPENLQLKAADERAAFRQSQVDKLLSCFRNSDVVIDAEKDGFVILGFECNKPGSNVLEFKLAQAGFQHFGFSVYPTDGKNYAELCRTARNGLQDKRKHRIVLFEAEEFFGRIIQNMLVDPKYAVTWVRSADEAYVESLKHSENIRLMMLSLTKDPKSWEMLAKIKKEGLSQFPIVLFTDVPLDQKIKAQLHKLGIKALIRKGASQEEILYVVQSFIMQPSVTMMRRNPRALVTLPVVYRVDGREVSSNTFTLSRDGVFIRDMNPPPTGTHVEIELLIPGRRGPIKAKAEVLYSVPYFVGVSRIHVAGLAARFVGLAEEFRVELDEYVASALTGYLIDPS